MARWLSLPLTVTAPSQGTGAGRAEIYTAQPLLTAQPRLPRGSRDGGQGRGPQGPLPPYLQRGASTPPPPRRAGLGPRRVPPAPPPRGAPPAAASAAPRRRCASSGRRARGTVSSAGYWAWRPLRRHRAGPATDGTAILPGSRNRRQLAAAVPPQAAIGPAQWGRADGRAFGRGGELRPRPAPPAVRRCRVLLPALPPPWGGDTLLPLQLEGGKAQPWAEGQDVPSCGLLLSAWPEVPRIYR